MWLRYESSGIRDSHARPSSSTGDAPTERRFRGTRAAAGRGIDARKKRPRVKVKVLPVCLHRPEPWIRPSAVWSRHRTRSLGERKGTRARAGAVRRVRGEAQRREERVEVRLGRKIQPRPHRAPVRLDLRVGQVLGVVVELEVEARVLRVAARRPQVEGNLVEQRAAHVPRRLAPRFRRAAELERRHGLGQRRGLLHQDIEPGVEI